LHRSEIVERKRAADPINKNETRAVGDRRAEFMWCVGSGPFIPDSDR
jgi:hypothetical protein